MSTQHLMAITISDDALIRILGIAAILLALVAINLWLSAERDLNRYIKEYYQQPRVYSFPVKRSRLRSFILKLLMYNVYENLMHYKSQMKNYEMEQPAGK